ncbi:hypothetical protein B0O99DRAFT_690552 [Bisporella sp. PMI_857]|nr:hypothetical protein B0O99DRAFT_690552 [Bisporella sp. PMI_857]
MCKHIPEVEVAIFAPCCRKWFECADCHRDTQDHPILKKDEIILMCKKCKPNRAFRKDASNFDESDEYCPYCDNHYVKEIKEPKMMLKVEGEDVRIDSRMIKDDRIRQKELRTIFDVEEAPNKLG